jgi:general secretion pathway protein A
LACLHAQGNLQQLRSFNRPVVLELKDEQGQAYFATLTELGHQTAMIKLAGNQLRLSTTQLQQYWYGKFTLLWHQPPGYTRAIHPGHEGESVAWLSRTMNRLEGRTTDQRKMSRYQDELFEQVRRFQLDKGLVADGIVGVQTLIQINNAIGLEAPVLVTKG